MLRTTVLLGLLAALSPFGGDVAAKSPIAVARGCRKAIAGSFRELARIGFKEIDGCERKRAAGRTKRDCTSLRPGTPDPTGYTRWEHRAREIIQARCPLDSPARDPFPTTTFAGDTVAGDPTAVIPSIRDEIQASARALQSGTTAALARRAPNTDACLVAIARERSFIAQGSMRRAVVCQHGIDARASVFEPLDTGCERTPSDSIVREAAGRIAGACAGVTGPEIGTCSPLPGCVLDAAAATGQELARLAFGQCGNGVVDGNEECDDGNEDPADGCNHCRAPTCGNGKVEPGEECDDGNGRDHDGCTQCRLPVCGDGILDVGAEYCDDGNTVPGDGCTDCQADPVSCSSAGVKVSVALDYDPNAFVQIAGMRLRLGYRPDVLSIPGSLVGPTINQRVRNSTGLASGLSFSVADRDFLPSEDAPDGVDDTLQTQVAVASGGIPSGPFEEVRFDCVGTEARVSDLTCTVQNVVDPFLNKVPDDVTATATRCVIVVEPAPTS